MNAVGAVRQIIIDAVGEESFAVYPTVARQEKTYPLVRMMIGDSKPNDSKTHTSPIDNVQIVADIFANTYNAAQQIDTIIRDAIDGFSGGVTTSDAAVHYIAAIRFLNRRDDFDEENKLFVRQCVYDVRYYRELPPLPMGTPFQLQSTAWPMWNNDADAKAGGTDERGNVFAALQVGNWYLTGPECDFAPYGTIKVIMQ